MDPVGVPAPARAHRGFFATSLHIHLLIGGISFVFTFVLTRVLGMVLYYVLQQPVSSFFTDGALDDSAASAASAMATTAAAAAADASTSAASSHITLIDKFVLVFEEEFGSSAAISPSDAYLFRFCGVLLYTLYAIVVAFALSFSALFHSFSFIFFVWRKWIGIGKGLYGLWNSDSGITGVW
ncbi:hypothetical protein BZA70DRAFT_283700 [Myxozyma melibiosi]|uniref:Copper transporter n=1 Tax=Myxozyma melibiosi TaxID=54550 RepID=A0ABR1F0R5_9ASCO